MQQPVSNECDVCNIVFIALTCICIHNYIENEHECNGENASHCIHVLCAGQNSVLDFAGMIQNGSAACLDHVQVVVRPEQHTLWSAANPCISLYLFIHLNLKVVTETSSGFLHSCLLQSSIIIKSSFSVINYVANVTSRHRSCSKYSVSQSYTISYLFLGKGGHSVLQTSLFPVPRAVPPHPYPASLTTLR